MADQACKNCKKLVASGNTCPLCKSNDLTSAWSGMLVVYDTDDSKLVEEAEVNSPGKYAIRVKG